MKKFLSIVLCISLVLVFSICCLAAEPDEGFYDDIIYVNPLYSDVVDEEYIRENIEEKAPVLYADLNPEYCETIEEAGEVLRRQLVSRAPVATVYFKADIDDEIDYFSEIFDEALRHTGKPTEGDYISKQFAGLDGDIEAEYKDEKIYLTLIYYMVYFTTAQQEETLNTAVDNLLDSLDLEGKDDYQKVSAIYKYICDNTTYDYTNLNDDNYKLKYSAYAALIDKTSVCQGYANLFYRLALEEGIDARLVSGMTSGGGHAWNIVKIGDYYYNVDATWDAGSGAHSYSYFLRCEENFINHFRDEEYDTAEFHEQYPMDASDYVYYPDDFDEDDEVQFNPGDYVASGYCGAPIYMGGKNLAWMINKNGVLTIKGNGPMESYEDVYDENGNRVSTAPWIIYNNIIKTLVIEEGVTFIGDYAFYDMNNLSGTLNLPSTLTDIGKSAFLYCKYSGELVVPEGVEYVGHSAFAWNQFTSVKVPSTLNKFEFQAFSGREVVKVNVSESNPNFCSVDGIVYSKDKKALVLIPCGIDGVFTVPDHVEILDSYLYDQGDLEGIIVPETVSTINDYAFYCFNGKITVMSRLDYIGAFAFRGSTDDVTSVYFMNGAPNDISSKGITELQNNAIINFYYPSGTEDLWNFDENGLWNGYEVKSYNGYGDLNMDFTVNIKDVYLARLIAAKLVVSNEAQLSLGDVDGDGKISAIDANIIRKFILKNIIKFPIEV
ncbi:MAG: leucine-rich repeat protein [Oscillospiraceae bacterium]|nr:leucine-rich repeat protein [Oscillospiraceae bacterium]